MIGNLAGETGSLHEVLDGDFSACALILALDYDTWAAAFIGIAHLRLHAGVSEIHLCADSGLAQCPRHFLIIAGSLLIHDENHNGRAGLFTSFQLAKMRKGRVEAGHANGKSCGRNSLRPEARDKAVIAPPSPHRAKAYALPAFIRRSKSELCLENRPGVIFQSTDHSWIENNAVRAETGPTSDIQNGANHIVGLRPAA